MRSQGNDEQFPEGWAPSPEGAVQGLGQRLRGRKSRRQFLRGLAAVAAGVLVLGGAAGIWWASRGTSEPLPGGITCAQASAFLRQDKAGALPPSDKVRLETHLTQCPRCSAMHRPG